MFLLETRRQVKLYSRQPCAAWVREIFVHLLLKRFALGQKIWWKLFEKFQFPTLYPVFPPCRKHAERELHCYDLVSWEGEWEYKRERGACCLTWGCHLRIYGLTWGVPEKKSSRESKVRATLYSIINHITRNCSSVAYN